MKILMLGWEYPPHISGGLGTACEGLTRALAKAGTQIHFVIPKVFGDEGAFHMKLQEAGHKTLERLNRGPIEVRRDTVSTQKKTRAILKTDINTITTIANLSKAAQTKAIDETSTDAPFEFPVQYWEIPAYLRPYLTEESYETWRHELVAESARLIAENPDQATAIRQSFARSYFEIESYSQTSFNQEVSHFQPSHLSTETYGNSLLNEVGRYTLNVRDLAQAISFDKIHAHDWMTYSAGVAAKEISGKPLICHVHSIESDRSGDHGNHRIREIEKWGLENADRIIAVSYYTREKIHRDYQIPLDKIEVVHNGVSFRKKSHQHSQNHQLQPGDHKTVLFLGRVTFQKGPDYFVEAARLVIPHIPNIKFVMVGTGDMLPAIKRRVTALKLDAWFEFPGFLSGIELDEAFENADLYVMPSVSEPFGISALEALNFDVPILISRQSGVSEVLAHALKADFWDIEELADLMIGALLHNELRNDLLKMAREELKRVHWDAAAEKTIQVYQKT